ncbi:hypothetical protein HSACCH_02446 [Halanaerobium saccharolyticum subsp. saccharolyticum DSM 6643]|uniref:Uncharacterized protein n=1 Tax=Halanaerobium saccharolyticum subsp. saccharolyticum DSM 6643 TaxID=1293054 RepID=M5E339_9FIRM|nr:EpsG family protein [Halanaerobium saccharolyticum]CCU80944.1 hypothetical protein HSACCH_02446 [Halanaerobium saccharolyticum subsp. saccharolyticum DSM 6643]
MIYLFVFLLLIIMSFFIDFRKIYLKISNSKIYFNKIFLFIVFIIWFLFTGFQDNVATDYSNYIKIFNSQNLLNQYFQKGELLFYYFISVLKYFKLSPKHIFIIISLIQITYILKVVSILKKKKIIKNHYIYFYVFFTFSFLFIRQMNTIRSVTAGILLCYGILLFCVDNRKIRGLFYIIITPFIHISSIFVILVYILFLKISELNLSRKFLFMYIIFSYIVFVSNASYNALNIILNYIPVYSSYINSKYNIPIQTGLGLRVLGVFLIMLYAIIVYKKKTQHKNKLFNFGIFLFGFEYILNMKILNRVSDFFSLFYILPLIFVFEQKAKNEIELFGKILIIVFLFLSFIIYINSVNSYSNILF